MDEEARWRAEALARQLQVDEYAKLADSAAQVIYALIRDIETAAKKGCENEVSCSMVDNSSSNIHNPCNCLLKVKAYERERQLANKILVRTMFR